jgi:hypothetical protein
MGSPYPPQIIEEIKQLLRLAVDEENFNYVIDALDILSNPTNDDFGGFFDDNGDDF